MAPDNPTAIATTRNLIRDTPDIYIYIIYTPNLGSGIALPGREREQSRCRGSTEGALGEHGGSTGGVQGSAEGARGSAKAQQVGA